MNAKYRWLFFFRNSLSESTKSIRFRPQVVALLGIAAFVFSPLHAATPQAIDPSKRIPLTTSAEPPDWALWQRQVLEQLYPAAKALVQKYTRPDGSLIWRDDWPGMDGSDEATKVFIISLSSMPSEATRTWLDCLRNYGMRSPDSSPSTVRSTTSSMSTTIGCTTVSPTLISISSASQTLD